MVLSCGKLEVFDLQQTMKSRFLLTLIVILTTFGAVFVSVCFDDLNEYDAAYIQGEMLKESSESLSGHRDRQAIPLPLVSAASNKNSHATAVAMTTSPTLVCLFSCVLLC
jgi:hypothetical protein